MKINFSKLILFIYFIIILEYILSVYFKLELNLVNQILYLELNSFDTFLNKKPAFYKYWCKLLLIYKNIFNVLPRH